MFVVHIMVFPERIVADLFRSPDLVVSGINAFRRNHCVFQAALNLYRTSDPVTEIHGVEITHQAECLFRMLRICFKVFCNVPGTGCACKNPALPASVARNRRKAQRDFRHQTSEKQRCASALTRTDHSHARRIHFFKRHGKFHHQHLIREHMVEIIVLFLLINVTGCK